MRFGVLKIAAIYTLIGLFWITFSDKLIFSIGITNTAHLHFISSIKGFVYVIVTGFVLYKWINGVLAELQQREKQYHSYFADNPTPMWIFNRNTLGFVEVNEAAIAHYGYTRDEFLKMSILDIRPAEDKSKLFSTLPILTGSYRDVGVWRHITVTGSVINVHITSHLITSGKNENVMVMARDITKQVVFEHKLQEANIQLSSMNETLVGQKRLLNEMENISKLGGWEYYPDEKKLTRSDGVYNILDFTSPDEKDPLTNFVNHIHPDDKEIFLKEKYLLDNEGVPMNITIRIINNRGQLLHIHQIASMEYRDGKPYRINGSMQDVTGVKILEQERNDYLLKLEDTLNSVSDAFFTLDREWNITSVNTMFKVVSGFKKEDVVHHNFLKLWPPYKDSIYAEKFAKVLNQKITVKFEEFNPFLKKWLRMICYPTKEGAAIYFTDITESKEKDIALKQALERYNLAASATQDILYEFDILDNQVTYAQSFGYFSKIDISHEAKPLKAWFSLVHPDDVGKIITAGNDSIKQRQTTYKCEYRVNCGNGQYRYVYDKANIIYSENNEPLRMIGAIRDIHDLKVADNEIKRLGEIVNKISNMVLITSNTRQVLWANSAFEKFIGYKLKEIIGRQPVDFIAGPDYDKALAEKIAVKTKNAEAFSIELPLVTKSGSQLWVFAEFTPLIDDENNYTGYITIYSDISSIKEKEEFLVKQNNLLREISWMGSHEVRKPLASIIALVELLKTSSSNDEKEELFKYINASTFELDSMLRKINTRIGEIAE